MLPEQLNSNVSLMIMIIASITKKKLAHPLYSLDWNLVLLLTIWMQSELRDVKPFPNCVFVGFILPLLHVPNCKTICISYRTSSWELMDPWTKNDSDKTQDICIPFDPF